jgi:DNA-binding transcriptional LysR family regulator
VTPAVRALTSQYPDLTVELLRTSYADQTAVLRDGRADVSIVRLPIDQQGLTIRPLFDEPRVAMLPADHRLAGKPVIRIGDLADDHLLQDPDAVPEWRDIAVELRAGKPGRVPVFNNVEEKLEHVAACNGISVLPLSTAGFYTRPDVVAVPIEDIGPNHVCLAWSATRRARTIHDFAEIATGLTWST